MVKRRCLGARCQAWHLNLHRTKLSFRSERLVAMFSAYGPVWGNPASVPEAAWSRRGDPVLLGQLANCPALFPFRVDPAGLHLTHDATGVEVFTDTDRAGYLRLHR